MTAKVSTVAAVRPSVMRSLLIVELNDGRRFTGPRKAIEAQGLAAGMAVFPGAVASLAETEARAAYMLAVKRLSRWERSAMEVSRYLAERGFGVECVAATIERLRDEHALNDQRAAESHVAVRQRSAGKGQRLVRRELAQRGIPASIAEAATAALDDAAAALELARVRGRCREWADATAFESTVGPFLQRRGFDYETARKALRVAWLELQQDAEGGPAL